MKVTRFEELEIWKESIRLCIKIINTTKESRMYSLRDQMTRSAISVPSNIAEGFERDSRKEFIRFLNIAKASCGELRTQLFISLETGVIKKDDCKLYIETTKKISAMINKFIIYLKNSL